MSSTTTTATTTATATATATATVAAERVTRGIPPSAPAAMRRELTAVENGVIGGLSGTIEVLLQQPSVAWKNALQQKRPISLNPMFLYRGVVINAASIAPITAVQFTVNGSLANALRAYQGITSAEALSDHQRLAIAATAGAASALVSTPAEIIMIQQQRSGQSLGLTASTLFRWHGARVFYKGFVPTAIRESLFTCGYLGLGPVIKEQLIAAMPDTFADMPLVAAALGSICAGLLAATLTQPADTVKTRLQGDITPKGQPTTYVSPMQAAKLIYSKEGPKTFFSGLVPRGLRMIGAVFILGLCKEGFTDLALKM